MAGNFHLAKFQQQTRSSLWPSSQCRGKNKQTEQGVEKVSDGFPKLPLGWGRKHKTLGSGCQQTLGIQLPLLTGKRTLVIMSHPSP